MTRLEPRRRLSAVVELLKSSSSGALVELDELDHAVELVAVSLHMLATALQQIDDDLHRRASSAEDEVARNTAQQQAQSIRAAARAVLVAFKDLSSAVGAWGLDPHKGRRDRG